MPYLGDVIRANSLPSSCRHSHQGVSKTKYHSSGYMQFDYARIRVRLTNPFIPTFTRDSYLFLWQTRKAIISPVTPEERYTSRHSEFSIIRAANAHNFSVAASLVPSSKITTALETLASLGLVCSTIQLVSVGCSTVSIMKPVYPDSFMDSKLEGHLALLADLPAQIKGQQISNYILQARTTTSQSGR